MVDKVEVINALVEFKSASLKLLDMWNKVGGGEVLNSDISLENYPFDKNFEEVVVDISNWAKNVEDSI